MVAEGVEKLVSRAFSQQEMAFNLLGLMAPAIVNLCQTEPRLCGSQRWFAIHSDLKDLMSKLRSEIMETSAVRQAVIKENAIENKVVNGEDSEALYKKVVTEPRANLKYPFPSYQAGTKRSSLFTSSSRVWSIWTRWLSSPVLPRLDLGKLSYPMGDEAYGKFSLEGCVEMAWMMGLIKNHGGPLKGKPYSGWVDASSLVDLWTTRTSGQIREVHP